MNILPHFPSLMIDERVGNGLEEEIIREKINTPTKLKLRGLRGNYFNYHSREKNILDV